MTRPRADVYEFLAFRNDNPNSIVQCITMARENARTIRDRISREMWEDINGLYHAVTRFDPAEQISSGPHRFCDAVKFGSHRFLWRDRRHPAARRRMGLPEDRLGARARGNDGAAGGPAVSIAAGNAGQSWAR